MPLVTGIGCIAALPAKCLEMGPPPPNLQAHLVTGGVPGREVQKVVKMARERADEYRLVADPDHRAAVVNFFRFSSKFSCDLLCSFLLCS